MHCLASDRGRAGSEAVQIRAASLCAARDQPPWQVAKAKRATNGDEVRAAAEIYLSNLLARQLLGVLPTMSSTEALCAAEHPRFPGARPAVTLCLPDRCTVFLVKLQALGACVPSPTCFTRTFTSPGPGP